MSFDEEMDNIDDNSGDVYHLQEISGIDYSEAVRVLEENDWNLEVCLVWFIMTTFSAL